ELAVAPDAAQHRFARHPGPLRRAGEPVCSAPSDVSRFDGDGMALDWLEIALRCWSPTEALGDRVFLRLGCSPSAQFRIEPSTAIGHSALLYLVDVERDPGAVDPVAETERVYGAIRDGLAAAASWLATIPVERFESLRAEGVRIDIFIGSWIDQDQF